MRIVIDLQACQTEGSKNRGIGRYSMALAQAMVRNAGRHEIWLALNGHYLESIEPIRAAFDDLMPQERIRTFEIPTPVADLSLDNTWRRQAAEYMREAFLADLRPDFVHTSSLFEGFVENAVTSVGRFDQTAAQAVTLYDLIPFLNPKPYLENPTIRDWYYRKLQSAKRADLLLAISESSRREGIESLHLPADRVVNISSAIDPAFRPIRLSTKAESSLRQRYGLKGRFVMYTGGIDHRKNIEGLIAAYAALPQSIRLTHQLAIVCSIRDEDRCRLGNLASSVGLGKEEVIFTGFVSESDLLGLYNLCTLFVFPSLHEGFGLPALEAMACGAPTIGADNSSIPEVIGRPDALFDALTPVAITRKIEEALRSEDRLRELCDHGLKQSSKFSWDASANRALAAMEAVHEKRQSESKIIFTPPTIRPRLAYISPLPPEKTGIADYSAELLPELSRFYEIDVIVNQQQISDPWICCNFSIKDLSWFETHAKEYDRILYQFGNSDFHTHMFEMLVRHPGTVVLHDFFLSGIQYWRECHHGEYQHFSRSLLLDHGYRALLDHLEGDWDTAIWRYPINHNIFKHATGVIVHSEYSSRMAKLHYGPTATEEIRYVPQLRAQPIFNRTAAREALGLKSEDFMICSFGLLGPTKLNSRLLDAFIASDLARDPNCHLVFVGENDGGTYGYNLLSKIKHHGLEKRIKITGFASAELFKTYLGAADAAVQLRTLSRGETSRTVLDCLGYGIPTVINSHGTMSELPDDVLLKLPDQFTDAELVEALQHFHSNDKLRRDLGDRAVAYLRDQHAPDKVGVEFYRAIEYFSTKTAQSRRNRLVQSIRQLSDAATLPTQEFAGIAKSIAINSTHPRLPQLLVNISQLRQHDGKSGIQRVVLSILRELLNQPPEGFRVEPVYIDRDAEWVGFRYARQYSLGLFEHSDSEVKDEVVEPQSGDILLELDLNQAFAMPLIQSGFYEQWRARGVKIHFVVYDLLPVLLPECFVSGAFEGFNDWIAAISSVADGLMCISRTVADELKNWLTTISSNRKRSLGIGWFHLGADIAKATATMGVPESSSELLKQLTLRPSILMVGTLEPRKGHAQAIDAMESLWKDGVDVNLVIVGKQGWMVDDLVARIKSHPELGRRIFLISDLSNEYLSKIYAGSSALLAASLGEGFGLPLIEAAHHKLPIIARDIPVFREIAGNHAFYFSGDESSLAAALRQWLDEYHLGRAPKSNNLPWQTWAESTTQLLDKMMAGRWEHIWRPDGSHHFRGSHHLLHTQCGEKRHGQIATTGKAGFLFFGPYLSLTAGHYMLRLFGNVNPEDLGIARIEVAAQKGALTLANKVLPKNATAVEPSSLLTTLIFALEHPCSDLEIRLWVNNESKLSISRLEIRPLDESSMPIESTDEDRAINPVLNSI